MPPRSLARIDVGLVIQRKASVSVKASVRQGSIIAGRLQSFTGGDSGRRGLTSGLGSPAGASAWRFVAGQRPVAAPTDVPSAERIAIFNPGDNEAQIAITVLLESDATAATSGTPPGAVPTPLTLTVPANSSAIADVASIAPAGQFNVSVTADELIVAERVLDYTLKGVVFTTVQLGSRLAAETWYFPIGVPTGATGRIDVLNSTGVPTTFSVKTVGAAGPVAVAGFESVKLPAGAVVSVPITGLSVGQSLVVEGAGALIVERMVNSPAGWSATLGLPMIG